MEVDVEATADLIRKKFGQDIAKQKIMAYTDIVNCFQEAWAQLNDGPIPQDFINHMLNKDKFAKGYYAFGLMPDTPLSESYFVIKVYKNSTAKRDVLIKMLVEGFNGESASKKINDLVYKKSGDKKAALYTEMIKYGEFKTEQAKVQVKEIVAQFGEPFIKKMNE